MVNRIEQFVRTVPKAELHVHLEGSLEPEMLFRLAERNRIALRWSSEEALLAAYEFANLEDFLTLYFEGCRVLLTERDFYDVTAAYLAKASEQGISRAEIFLGPQSFTERGVPLEAIMHGVLGAIQDARSSTAISAAYILSVHRHRPVEEALHLLDSIGPWSEHVVGVGMGGPEILSRLSKLFFLFRGVQRGYFSFSEGAERDHESRRATDLSQMTSLARS
jgi:adenine deaminase